jgi:hypothetical protein
MDYFSACEQLPPKPRFAVGQQVRIVGPNAYGIHMRIGTEALIHYVGVHSDNVDLNVGESDFVTYPASSLAPIAEVPAPKFKRGDKVRFTETTKVLSPILEIMRFDGKWFYQVASGDTKFWTPEHDLFPPPAEPVYLPTRWINIDRTQNSLGNYESGYARGHHDPSIRRGRDTIILHDMPADENGVQVDFVTLTSAGYNVHGSADSDTGFWINFKESSLSMESYPTAIDAWRAAGRHYLESKGGK